jgi:hypothetical protein
MADAGSKSAQRFNHWHERLAGPSRDAHRAITTTSESLDCTQAPIRNENYSNLKYLGAQLAEGVGFEPTVPLQARRFSRPVP